MSEEFHTNQEKGCYLSGYNLSQQGTILAIVHSGKSPLTG